MVIDETELEGLTEDQRDAYIALKEGRNVFLSGNAGTGKSYVLNRFIDDLEARSVPYTAMAPTGTLFGFPREILCVFEAV